MKEKNLSLILVYVMSNVCCITCMYLFRNVYFVPLVVAKFITINNVCMHTAVPGILSHSTTVRIVGTNMSSSSQYHVGSADINGGNVRAHDGTSLHRASAQQLIIYQLYISESTFINNSRECSLRVICNNYLMMD